MESPVYQMQQENSIYAPRLRPESEVGTKTLMKSDGSCLGGSSMNYCESGERGRLSESVQPVLETTPVSRRRCPSPNSLARLDPKPPRVLHINRGDFIAFKEMLAAHRLVAMKELLSSGAIKERALGG